MKTTELYVVYTPYNADIHSVHADIGIAERAKERLQLTKKAVCQLLTLEEALDKIRIAEQETSAFGR